jgi:hypothetical protein
MRKIIIYIVIFITGFLIGGSIVVGAKPAKIETPVPVHVAVDEHQDDWKQLKEIDDRGFSQAAQFAGACSDIVTGLSLSDSDTFQQGQNKVNRINREMTNLAVQRRAILSRLSY